MTRKKLILIGILVLVALLVVNFLYREHARSVRRDKAIQSVNATMQDLLDGVPGEAYNPYVAPVDKCATGDMGIIGSYSSCYISGTASYVLKNSSVSDDTISLLDSWLDKKLSLKHDITLSCGDYSQISDKALKTQTIKSICEKYRTDHDKPVGRITIDFKDNGKKVAIIYSTQQIANTPTFELSVSSGSYDQCSGFGSACN